MTTAATRAGQRQYLPCTALRMPASLISRLRRLALLQETAVIDFIETALTLGPGDTQPPVPRSPAEPCAVLSLAAVTIPRQSVCRLEAEARDSGITLDHLLGELIAAAVERHDPGQAITGPAG
jgi:hypothetical protein